MTHVPDTGEYHFEVDIWNEQVIRRERQRSTVVTGRPLKCAFEPVKADGTVQYASDGTTSQAYNLMIWPVPDDDYVLEYRYNMIPTRVSSAAIYNAGGAYHHETLVASCLAAAELERDGQKGPQWEKFMERLRSSISHDKKAFRAEKIGQNRDTGIMRDGMPVLRGPYNEAIVTYGDS